MQEKYLKRKTEKYTVQATVHRVTARSLAEALFSWRPEKIQYMRADTLAMLLTMANIGAHGKTLVLDGCGGLVTGAVAERMGGFGQVKHQHRVPWTLSECVATAWSFCHAMILQHEWRLAPGLTDGGASRQGLVTISSDSSNNRLSRAGISGGCLRQRVLHKCNLAVR